VSHSDGSDGGDGLSEVVVVTGELKKSERISAGAEKGRMDHIVEMTNGAVVVGRTCGQPPFHLAYKLLFPFQTQPFKFLQPTQTRHPKTGRITLPSGFEIPTR
jgi:hypothetical protein